jgi:hypothetical protein
VPPGVPCFEYRHAPDPGTLESVLVPYLADLRRDKIAENETAYAATGDATTKKAVKK